MEPAGANPGIYCSPKCGLNFLRNLQIAMNNPVLPTLFVRNPYSRLVSFYVNKVIYAAVSPNEGAFHTEPANVEALIKEAELRLEGVPKDIGLGDEVNSKIRNWSFETFVRWLVAQNADRIDRHLKPQHLPSFEDSPREMDKIIHGVAGTEYILFQIEKLKEPETQERFRRVFSIDSSINLNERFYMTHRKSNKTPRSASCHRPAHNMTPAEMRKQKYIPSCVNKYYSQEIAKLVYNYYYEDFKKYGYSEDSYK